MKKTEHLRLKTQTTAQSSSPERRTKLQASQSKQSPTQSTPEQIIKPPLPKDFMGARIAPHEHARNAQGDVICAYICKPEEIVGKHYWIWYDYKTGQPCCETEMPRARYIPEAFKQQQSADRASHSQSQSQVVAITLSHPSMGSASAEEQGFAHGGGVSDDFKRFLEQHPDLSFDEALRRFKEEEKAKQRNKGIKLH